MPREEEDLILVMVSVKCLAVIDLIMMIIIKFIYIATLENSFTKCFTKEKTLPGH